MHIKYSTSRPSQIIIKYDYCTLLLFSSGNFRIMGKCTNVEEIINPLVSALQTFISLDPFCVSQTVVCKLASTSLNLHYYVNHIPTAMFECELFPALSIAYFNPLHVNLFSTGKVVILGNDALNKCKDIIKWINKHIKI